MNTEHTNQSSQAEPAPRSTIDLQSVPKRQRDFTAENIRDIAHECMRIGDNDQAEVVFAIADALRDGNLIIQPPARQQAEPVAWVRFCSDGGYEGPIMNSDSRMDGGRRTSGAWTPLYAAQPPAVAVRIRELEAQLNAAILARREAQQVAREAIEARNRAGVEIRRPLAKRIRALEEQLATATAPTDHQIVPVEPTPEMVNAGAEGDSQFYDHAHFVWRAMLATAPQGAVAATLPPYNVYSDDDGDSWREHPADADFVEGLKLGEEFELLAGWRPVRVTFRVTKVPDDESDDYEVEEVTAPAAAQKGGA